MQRIVDYAGLFPPANLDLPEALRQFHGYRGHPHSEMLGRFVIPLSRISEVGDEWLANTWSFATVLRSGSMSLDEAVITVQASKALIETIEHDLPADTWEEEPLRNFLQDCRNRLSVNRRVFLELDWRKEFEPVMAGISRYGAGFGVKLRTGGLTPESVPPAEAVARFLEAAARWGLAMKFTAGLHVPVPNQNPEVGARMHGFLNVVSAAFLAYSGRGNRQEMIEVLDRFEYPDFQFSGEKYSFGKFEFTVGEIRLLRRDWVVSFGSCSFEEPLEHLERHGLLRAS